MPSVTPPLPKVNQTEPQLFLCINKESLGLLTGAHNRKCPLPAGPEGGGIDQGLQQAAGTMRERTHAIWPEPAKLPEPALPSRQHSNKAVGGFTIPNVARLRPLPRNLPTWSKPNTWFNIGLMAVECMASEESASQARSTSLAAKAAAQAGKRVGDTVLHEASAEGPPVTAGGMALAGFQMGHGLRGPLSNVTTCCACVGIPDAQLTSKWVTLSNIGRLAMM